MIHRDIEELAENKLVLLYILSETGMPLSKNQITQVVLENSLMNYFSMQQFLAELVQRGLVVRYEDMGRHLYRIQREGLKTLRLFSDRISLKLKETLRKYLQEKEMLLRRETRAHSSYSADEGGSFSIVLRLTRGEDPSMEIKLKTDTENGSKEICSNWNTDAEALYQGIIKMLYGNRKD
ncbi:MAG: DUF4364 family protein [Bacillota bacterium]|jgi:predicted transcriptional regulator|nr:DUF4364 family protein [Bacillota bacterium]MDD3299109.1 DUF4364 family protein [Bacillota bacterium]MDD3851127.1 DUF4364 family protein [Bacillota bacterium]MDD4706948.1 DUF4364 family protein [Bacillota bacterium]